MQLQMNLPMIRWISLFTLLLLLVAVHTHGQLQDYSYRREINGINGQWNRLVIPADVFGKTGRDLADIRIYGLTVNNDTIEAPYLLRVASEKASVKEVKIRRLNDSYTDKGYYVTFEVPSNDPVNEIGLDIKQRNFDWLVKLEGSNDQQDWFTVLNDYRIVSIKNDLTDYTFTTLSFPNAVYRYFRLFVASRVKPELLAAKIFKRDSLAGVYQSLPTSRTVLRRDKQAKQTEILLNLRAPVPVSYLKIGVKDSFDFFRPVTISYLTDSVKTEKGWVYNFLPLTSGTLNSLDKNEFRFPSTTLQKLKVTIHDHDNQPLDIGLLQVKGYVHEVVARFTKPATYYLVYGNKQAVKPQYDLQQFAGKIPAELQLLTLGMEQQTAAAPDKITPLFSNKAWLWVIMATMILLLGVFSVRMMRKRL